MSEDHLKWPYLKTYFEQQLSTSDTTEKKSSKYIWVVGTACLIFKIYVNQLKILVSWQLGENY